MELVRFFRSTPQSLPNAQIYPHQREVRQIEMMLGAFIKQVEISKVQVSFTSGDVSATTHC